MKRCRLLSVIIGFAFAFSSVPAFSDTVDGARGDFPGKGDYQTWIKGNHVYNAGVEKLRAGQQQEAIEQFKAAISIYPFDPHYFNDLGLSYKQLGDLTNAEATYRKSIAVKPMWESWANLANILGSRGKTEEAISAYPNALDLGPPPNVRQMIEQYKSDLKSATETEKKK